MKNINTADLSTVCGGGPLGSKLNPIETANARTGFTAAQLGGLTGPERKLVAGSWVKQGDAVPGGIKLPRPF